MTEPDDDAIETWFRARGHGVVVVRESGRFWASLTVGERMVAPRYGRGDTRDAALRRAKARYIEEQAPRDIE